VKFYWCIAITRGAQATAASIPILVSVDLYTSGRAGIYNPISIILMVS